MWILLLAFLVLGPFALVLVWKSPKMGRGVKAVFAAMILLYSALCIYFIYKVGALEYQQLRKIGDTIQQIRGN